MEQVAPQSHRAIQLAAQRSALARAHFAQTLPLSYREKELLGRGLTKEEARHVTDMARRIAALLLMGPALDANYEAVKRDTYLWSPGTQ
jgi:hypothetical protein